MRAFQAASFTIFTLPLLSLIANARSTSDRRANYNNGHRLNKRSFRDHPEKPPSLDGRVENGFNDGIHLELAPSGGVLSTSSWIGEVNAGIEWQKIETVVSFGDSYSQVGNGGDGSPPAPLRFVGKNPSAGGRNTNGETWIEQLVHFQGVEEHPRRLLSYAKSGATTDREIWPSRKWADDFPSQVARFYANISALQLNPATTLYVAYFGFNDFWSTGADGNQMERAGKRAVNIMQNLHENAGVINFLLVGIQFTTGIAVDYNRALWNGLRDLHYDTKAAGDGNAVNFAFVDSGRFFSAIHEWYPMFGYTSSKHCLEGQRASIEDECEDPERTVYYMGAHPSRQTHRILAEYVSSVLRGCWISDDKRPYGSLTRQGGTPYYQLHRYLPDSLTTAHLFMLSVLILALCTYRPIMRASRRGGFGGAIALLSPPHQH